MSEFTNLETYRAKNKKTYQYVFDYFFEQIFSGELKLNDKIPPEREIAEKLDVSRNSIREVMHMLELNGILECRQGSGNYIRCEPQEYMVKFTNMVMALQDISYAEVYHTRMGFETVALKQAMYRITDEELKEMNEILTKMDALEDPVESAKLDIEFHNRLITASQNRLIKMYSAMLGNLMNQFIADFRTKIMESKQRAEVLQRAHWNIYDALVDKDFIAGSAAMQKHFDVVGEQVELMGQVVRKL